MVDLLMVSQVIPQLFLAANMGQKISQAHTPPLYH